MKYSCSLRLECSPIQKKNITSIFGPEDKTLGNNRGYYKIEETEKGITFRLEAEDATALRALMNSVAKSLILIEKSWSIKNGR
jgi:tRNA threonylcarbamoyladenosine modification (KEOPS) complex  Pcc1 subunit